MRADDGERNLRAEARAELGRANLLARRAVAAGGLAARRRRARGVDARPGVTAVTVTWNSLPFLKILIEAVQKYSPSDTEILVVDNNSTDGTKAYLASRPDVRTVSLPVNLGHGLGLDLAMQEVSTTKVVALDVDAFPISGDWLDAVLEPLDTGAKVAGAHYQRCFIHPSYLAIKRQDYFDLNLSFKPLGVSPPPGRASRGIFMDVGEALSHNVAVACGSATLHRIPVTSTKGPGMGGSVYGNVVYHSFYSTQGDPAFVAEAKRTWDDAVGEYL